LTNPRTVLVDAHRGASATHPENTLAAFRAAVEAGADSVELDVQLTSDGVPVVIHDDSVDRTTNGSGAVTELTLKEIRTLDAGSWRHSRFSGERVPTLDETLVLLASAPRINMELKSEEPRLAEVAVEAIEARRLHPGIMVSSFHMQHLVAVKRRLPGVRTHLFLSNALPDGFWERHGRWIGSVGVRHDHVTESLVAQLRDHGRPTWAWTVDDPARALEVADAGVEAITTNDPVRIIAALRDAGYG